MAAVNSRATRLGHLPVLTLTCQFSWMDVRSVRELVDAVNGGPLAALTCELGWIVGRISKEVGGGSEWESVMACAFFRCHYTAADLLDRGEGHEGGLLRRK